ncbi:DNA-binding response regulator [Desulfoluna limicola]|uniref:DNA-binding response regulator n=1 Tax=Desulfoluna limicola TaxID=2810562 RepID=A0ABM7PGI2_9BACT|nr:response regulator transcription factor [Desulfoluna limicola]BCS96704.1 DNA-binding response regulator [Desulfoluna limicola]
MAIKIVLADDHNIIREGLAALLSNHPDMEVMAQANNGRDAVKYALQLKPDIVVMDISMPDLNGIDATRMIKAENPKINVIALSVHTGRRFVTGMIKAGVSGYMLKHCAIEELLEAITLVYKNKSYLSPDIAATVMTDYANNFATDDEPTPLSLREREVLQLVAEGMTSEQIAGRLNVTAKTVSAHRQQVMKKLNIGSIAELTKYAIREGIVALE